MIAALVREPFNLRLEEIERLDRWTIKHVLFHPINEKTGALALRPKDQPAQALTPEQQFENWGKKWGFADHEIALLWKEKCAREQREGGTSRGG